jgi:predicted RNA-binding Zn ribbon-like protein
MASILIGGRLAIDFANAEVADPARASPREDCIGLMAFLAARGVISAARELALRGLPEVAPEETGRFVEKARQLQSAIRDVLAARIRGAALSTRSVQQINSVLAFTESYDRLEPVEPADGEQDWQLRLAARSEGLEWLLTAIARSAAEIIAKGAHAPVRRCANPACKLLFFDDSRTGKRRWCSMKTCGNRAKVAAHYRRSKSKPT